MWLEYIRYRFRLDKTDDLLELTQLAALKGLRNSPRCRGWRVLPAADDPSLLVLEIEWDPGVELTAFRGSEEFAAIHASLALQARSLEEADYSVNSRLLRQVLGGPDTLFRVAEDIVVGILHEPELGWRFQSADGSKRGRLGLWLLEVLGGPDLFSSSFPGSGTREGPLANDRLDLEERERLLEIARNALPPSLDDMATSVMGNLRAHLPLHPAPRSPLDATRLLGPSTVPATRDDDAALETSLETGLDDAEFDQACPDRGGAAPNRPAAPADRHQRVQTGVRSRVEAEAEEPEVKVAGHPWPLNSRPPSPTLRSRGSGRWPRGRARPRE